MFGLRVRFSRNEIVQRVVHAASASVANRFRPLAYSAPYRGPSFGVVSSQYHYFHGPVSLHGSTFTTCAILLTFFLLETERFVIFTRFFLPSSPFCTRANFLRRGTILMQRPRRIGRFYPLIDNIILYPYGQLEENRFFFFKKNHSWRECQVLKKGFRSSVSCDAYSRAIHIK